MRIWACASIGNKKSQRDATPEGVLPRRLTLQRASRPMPSCSSSSPPTNSDCNRRNRKCNTGKRGKAGRCSRWCSLGQFAFGLDRADTGNGTDAAQFCRLLPSYHDHRPLNDDRPLLGRGDCRLGAGEHFHQGLVKGREIGREIRWPLFLGGRGSATHWCGLRVRLGRNLIGTAPERLWIGRPARQSLPLFPRSCRNSVKYRQRKVCLKPVRFNKSGFARSIVTTRVMAIHLSKRRI